MPFKKYTQKDIDALNEAHKFKTAQGNQLHPGYYYDITADLEKRLLGLGENYPKDLPKFLQALQSGKLRAGNGEKFPAEWSDKEFACYVHDEEEKLKEKKKYIDRNEPVPEELDHPAFLFYDETNKRFRKINVEHYFDREAVEGNYGTLKDVGTIELDAEKVPADAPDTAREESKNLNKQLDTEMVADIAEAINKLYSDLRKRDSIFSSNSPEYTQFYEGLKTLRSQFVDEFGKPKDVSMRELASFFRDPENNVFAKAQEYLTAKSKQSGALSDRQADRMSMCHRFMSIQNAIEDLPNQYAAGTLPDCKAEILSATMAHKAILGTLKAAGPLAVKRELGSSTLYDAHFKTLHTHIQEKVSSDKIAKFAAGSPENAAQFFSTRKIQRTAKEYRATNEEYLAAKEAMAHKTPDEVNAVTLAEYMMARTHDMLEEMNTHDSFIHSNEQKQFRVALENLHDKLVGCGRRAFFGTATLTDELEDIAKATEAYRMHHLGDNADDPDMNAVHRLGFAEELHLCSEFLVDYKNGLKDTKELFTKLTAHQQKMRELDQKYTTYLEEQFKEGMDFSTEISPELQKAEKDFKEAFSDLITVHNYDKVLDQKVEEMKGTMVEGDEALLGAAATNNITVKQVKAGIEAKTIPDPTKVEENDLVIDDSDLNPLINLAK